MKSRIKFKCKFKRKTKFNTKVCMAFVLELALDFELVVFKCWHKPVPAKFVVLLQVREQALHTRVHGNCLATPFLDC